MNMKESSWSICQYVFSALLLLSSVLGFLFISNPVGVFFLISSIFINPFGGSLIDTLITRVSQKELPRGKLYSAVAILFVVFAFVFSKNSPIKAEESSAKVIDEEKLPMDAPKADTMEVHFINVGQGDSTLITCGDQSMLIDAGDNSKGTAVQLYLKKQGIEKLNYLILTHPDADHIGGADVIVTKFPIDNIFMSAFTKDNKTYNELIDAINYKNMKWSTPSVGSKYSLGSAEFTIIAPNKTYDTPNNSSVGFIIKNGDNKFLFAGDAESEAESDILANKINLDVDVYQVNHHGSRTASSDKFLKAMSPSFAIISCGEDNQYGHPHAETLNNLRSLGVNIFRTDEQGTIVATSDGKGITFSCSPTESWQAGEPIGSSASDTSQKSGTEAVTSTESPVAPAVEAASPSDTGNGDITVHITNTGKCYHVGGCASLKKSDIEVTLQQAKDKGLKPCSKCNPPQ